MLSLFRDLVSHKESANTALLRAIGENDRAVADPEITDLLHHILLANRFWLLTIRGAAFVHEHEARPAESFEDLRDRYLSTWREELAWLSTATEADLDRTLESPLIPGGRCSVAQAFVQMCLHAHGHRAQCAKLLRRHGGQPPATDFILWIAETGTR